jgi:RimJ/RimL family protein N-acetyltransferase
MIRFYCLDASAKMVVNMLLPDAADLRLWRPGENGFPPSGSHRFKNVIWWLFCRLGVFARPDFIELTIWFHGKLAHRLVVTPRWWRFAFMASEDLQIGDLWTAPAMRGRGLAQCAIAAAHRAMLGSTPRVWYVTDEANIESVRLAESCGYTLVGTGTRTAPLGFGALGRFRLTHMQASVESGSLTESRPIGRRAGRLPAG